MTMVAHDSPPVHEHSPTDETEQIARDRAVVADLMARARADAPSWAERTDVWDPADGPIYGRKAFVPMTESESSDSDPFPHCEVEFVHLSNYPDEGVSLMLRPVNASAMVSLSDRGARALLAELTTVYGGAV
jgi:hypothetical protein